MSRTDHHRPWQIRADDPDARARQNDPSYHRHVHYIWRDTSGDCTDLCGWTLPHSVVASGPPRWFRRHRWFGPERVRERAELGRMIKEYRVNYFDSDYEYDFANHQHRHRARWEWF